ncbi:MAG TPA: T9SS type A sorting domain-containing protein [Chitinophagaceae bacterium]|nr:T9SS type A sorting domain-containing protein [Chitinophagaceae bacterium]
MRKTATNLTGKFALFFFTAIVIFFSCNNDHERYSEEESGEEGGDMYNEAAKAQQFEFERTKDPSLGYVPKERLAAAYEATEHSKQIALRSRITALNWVERGPYADEVGMNNGNLRDGWAMITSGRMKSIWVDLSDATGNTVWAGGIGGGLWKTADFKNYPATWASVNDFFTNMSIGSICQDPTNHNIMYFGTGERTFNFDAIRGGGVWKSTDHGLTWTLLSATSSYFNVSKVLCDASGNLYVGTIVSNTGGGSSGLFRSINGGTSFTNISPNGIDSRISDFVISSTGRFHVACSYYGSGTPGYRYTDNPSTVTSAGWTASGNPASTHLPETTATNYNCVLACNGNTLYAAVSNSSGLASVYKSTNGGVGWAITSASPSNTGNTAFSNGQGWYCLGIDVNPADANNVIVGSLNCYATTNGGTSWTQVSDWSSNYSGAATGQYVHADIQTLKWFASDEILIGTDGGLFYSPDAAVTFEDRNSGLNIKQFYSCAFHPTLTDYFLAGAQDNGCHQFTTPGLNSTIEVSGGDGAYVHIDQNESNYQFGSYIYNRFRRSTNDGNNWSQVNFYKGTSGSPVDFGSFINPTDYDNTANILYCGADAGEFFRWSSAQTTPATPAAPSNNYLGSGFPAGANILTVSGLAGKVSAVTVSPYTANRIYLGTGSSKLIKIDNAHTFTSGSAGTDITGSSFPASSTISCIATGTNDNNLIATFSNYGVNNIWVSTNGGTIWTAIDGNLPDMPVRWAVFDPTSSNAGVWIATETGVWSTTSINGSSTVWAASFGFPTVRTDMIKYRAADQTLVAATHGRGLWTQSQANVLPINTFVLRGKWKNSAVELSWDYSNTAASSSFEVESSTNGTYFKKTGISQINTTYMDPTAASDVYYRVKGKTIFGGVSYSNVIHLQKGMDIKDITSVKLYPNPIRSNLKIAFAASGNGIARYQVTAINGQVVWKRDEEISATGEYIREWSMLNLKPGTYLFTVIYNNKKITQKFSKL